MFFAKIKIARLTNNLHAESSKILREISSCHYGIGEKRKKKKGNIHRNTAATTKKIRGKKCDSHSLLLFFPYAKFGTWFETFWGLWVNIQKKSIG